MLEFKRRIGYHVELVGCFTKRTSTTNFRKNIACKYMKCSIGKVNEINPKIDDVFFDTLFQKCFKSGEYILLSGELPSKWQ